MVAVVEKLLGNLRDRGGLQGKDIANIVDVSTATVSRWSHGRSAPNIQTQKLILALWYVVERLAEFNTPDEIRLWLHAPNHLLDGERAIDLIIDDRSKDILAMIERVDAGAYI